MSLAFALALFVMPVDVAAQPAAADSVMTVDVHDEPLRALLDKISRETTVQFVYDDALVDPVRATVRCEACKPMRIMALALENTPLEAILQTGSLVVIRKKREEGVLLSGVVRDAESGLPLAFAHVIHGDTGTSTDEAGRFALRVVSHSRDVEVRYLGYESKSATLSENESATVLLEPGTAELGAVIVHGGAIAAADDPRTQASMLTGRQLDAIPSVAGADPMIGLSRIPGVEDIEERAGALYVRGATPDDVLVEWAGIPLFNTDHFFGMISAINPESVEDATMYRYGAPSRLGGRTGGYVELAPASAFGGFLASGTVSPLHVAASTRFPLGRSAGLLVAARSSLPSMEQRNAYRTYFDSVLGSEDDRPGFSFRDLNARLAIIPGSRSLFSLNGYASGDRLDRAYEEEFSLFDDAEQDEEDIDDQDPEDDSDAEDDDADDFDPCDPDDCDEEFSILESEPIHNSWSSRGMSAQWLTAWNDRHQTHWQLSLSRYSSQFDYRRSEEAEDFFETHRFAFSSVEERRLRWGHDMSLGSHELSMGGFLKRVALKESDGLTERLDDVEQLFEDSDWAETASISGLYADWNLSGRRFDVASGLRVVRFGPSNQLDVEPRLRGAFSVSESLSWTASWERHHQYLFRVFGVDVLEEPRDRWEIPDHEPSASTLRSTGVRWHQGSVSILLEAFSNVFEGVALLSRGRNAESAGGDSPGSGLANGIEAQIRVKKGPWVAWSSYTRSRVEYTFDWLNDGASFPALHDRPHATKTMIEWRNGNWKLGSSIVVASGRPAVIPDGTSRGIDPIGTAVSGTSARSVLGQRLPVYERLDLHLRRHAQFRGAHTEVDLTLINVGNRSNVRYRRFNQTDDLLQFSDVQMLGFTPTLTIRVGRGSF